MNGLPPGCERTPDDDEADMEAFAERMDARYGKGEWRINREGHLEVKRLRISSEARGYVELIDARIRPLLDHAKVCDCGGRQGNCPNDAPRSNVADVRDDEPETGAS